MEPSLDAVTWNNKFLCLFGLELLCVDAGWEADDSDDGILDTKYKHCCDSTQISGWAHRRGTTRAWG